MSCTPNFRRNSTAEAGQRSRIRPPLACARVASKNGRMAGDDLQGLRIAVHDGDRSTLVRILDGGVRRDALQLVGDALAGAAGRVAGADELASAWSEALRERDWAGDEELATELDAALGRRPARRAHPCPSTWRSSPRCSKPGSARRAGASTWRPARCGTPRLSSTSPNGSRKRPPTSRMERWLYVGPEGSREGYRDMEDFIARMDDADRSGRLGISTASEQ
jgi:hypothetical protein